MDVWIDDSYLFSINELSVKFEGVVKDDEDVASTEAGVEEKPVATTATTSKPADSTPKPTAQPAHTHNYTSNVTAQPACVNAGEKTFTCTGCGEKFTDNAEWNDHCIANFEANGPFIACAGNYLIGQHFATYTYDYVKVADAWDETVTTYRCSVCGATR